VSIDIFDGRRVDGRSCVARDGLFSFFSNNRVDNDVIDLLRDNLDTIDPVFLLIRRIYCDNEVFIFPSWLVTIGNPCD
jgi:hypothetical protein